MAAPSNDPKRLVSLLDIGRLAKVSSTTVSLALRNSPRISAATRLRVQAVATKLGYRQNPLVTAHMSYVRGLHPHYTGQCIAFICNRSLAEAEAENRTPLWRYVQATRARAKELGFELEFFNLAEPGLSPRRLTNILAARGIRGVIFHPMNESDGLVGLPLDPAPFAMVMIEHVFIEPRLNKVCDDQFSTIGRLIQRLLDYGYHRVGIAMPTRADNHANHYWLAGYQVYQSLTREENRVPHLIAEDWSKEVFLRWFGEYRPDAVITIDDDIVLWLAEAGIRVPDDVGCATLYWKDDRSHLGGFYQNHEHIGAAAVDLVAAQLYHNERGLPEEQKTVLVESVWKEGATLCRKTPLGTQSPLRVWMR